MYASSMRSQVLYWAAQVKVTYLVAVCSTSFVVDCWHRSGESNEKEAVNQH